MRRIHAVNNLFSFIGVAATLSLAGCTQPDSKPIAYAADAATSYLEAKRSYVSALDHALRPNASLDDPYRLVAVAGPQWQIGSVIDPGDSLNPLTNKCLFASADLPEAWTPWTSLPTLSQQRSINFGAGLPQATLKILGKSAQVGANLDLSHTGHFELIDLQSKVLPQDDFESGLSADCRSFLANRGGMVVRGIINGREIFKSGRQISVGANIKVIEDQLLQLKYDDRGDFQLEDKDSVAKIYMVAYYARATRSGGDPGKLMAPSADQLKQLEKLGLQ